MKCNSSSAPAEPCHHRLVLVPTRDTLAKCNKTSDSTGRGGRLCHTVHRKLACYANGRVTPLRWSSGIRRDIVSMNIWAETSTKTSAAALFSFLQGSFSGLFCFKVSATDDDTFRLTGGTTRKSPDSSEFSCEAGRKNPYRCRTNVLFLVQGRFALENLDFLKKTFVFFASNQKRGVLCVRRFASHGTWFRFLLT